MIDEIPPDEPAPAQIPLLEDIVDAEPAKRALPKKKRINHSLDLDPEPPLSRGPFGLSGAPVGPARVFRETADIAGAPHTTFNHVPWSVVEPLLSIQHALDYVQAPPQFVSASFDREAALRAGADRVVENLVKEYSHEFVRRLQRELTSLLNELNVDKDNDT